MPPHPAFCCCWDGGGLTNFFVQAGLEPRSYYLHTSYVFAISYLGLFPRLWMQSSVD
jgi:hypothetical protein